MSVRFLDPTTRISLGRVTEGGKLHVIAPRVEARGNSWSATPIPPVSYSTWYEGTLCGIRGVAQAAEGMAVGVMVWQPERVCQLCMAKVAVQP